MYGFIKFHTILFRFQQSSNNVSIAYLMMNSRQYCYSTAITGNNYIPKTNHWKPKSILHSISDTLMLKSSHSPLKTAARRFSTIQERSHQTLDYLDAGDKDLYDILARDMTVQKDFLSEEEESSLLFEVERYMSRLRYEFDHWDNAIHGFRETEKKSWNENNSKIINRVKSLAFGTEFVPLPFVHVLDISKEGYIKPHVDAIRFCGDTIAGMCLLSSCVMRLALEKDASKYGDVHLPRRCLYIMKNRVRYEFTHEVLKEGASIFRNQTVPRERRISIICRCEPNPADTT